MAYKLNLAKSKQKLRLMSDKQIELLISIFDEELINRKLQRKQQTRLRSIIRSFDNRPTVRTLGDSDGDVLWKHHGCTEVEAFEDYLERGGDEH